MECIRVLHVLGSLNIGGAETMVMNLYRNVDKNNIQFDFVVHGSSIGKYEDEIKKMGGRIYRLPKYRVYNHLLYKRKWKEFFKTHPEYKIIHAHMRSTASIYLKVAKKMGLKTICHSHSTSNGKGLSAIVKKVLQHNIIKYADYLLGCSYKANEWLYGKGINEKENCYVFNNSIDTKKFLFNEEIRKKYRKKYGLTDKYVIGQIGRFISIKNYDYTISLFSEYQKINPNSFLVLIGDGPLYSAIKEKIDNLLLNDKVLILQNIFNVNEIMQALDVFIMPSLYEGLPLTLVEAQAASLPCIVSKNISAGFLINDLINFIDINDDYTKTIDLLENVQNNIRKNRFKNIKDAGFDIGTSTKWLTKFYIDIIKRGR